MPYQLTIIILMTRKKHKGSKGGFGVPEHLKIPVISWGHEYSFINLFFPFISYNLYL